MAKLNIELPTEVMNEIKEVEKNADAIFGGMTRAGAELVWHNVKLTAPTPEIASRFKLSKTYKTPTDGGINTKVYCSGYIPFSDPNRKYFSRSAKGHMYHTTKGVPVDFLAKLYEYGRSSSPFPKKPFFRNAFRGNEIEKVMLKAQKELSGGLLDDDFAPADASEVPFL